MVLNSLENMCCVSWILYIKNKSLQPADLFVVLYQMVNILTGDQGITRHANGCKTITVKKVMCVSYSFMPNGV